MSNEMKTPNMSAFIGSGFDCEFFYDRKRPMLSHPTIGQLTEIDSLNFRCEGMGMFDGCRPRLNKPQVLDDYSVLPRGFQYVIRFSNYKILNGAPVTSDVHQWESLRNMIGNDNYDIEWVVIIGVTEEYREWGESVGMEWVSDETA